MKSAEFQEYRARYHAAIRNVLQESESGRLDEAGFPAYSHANPLINWLFWQRLHTAMNYIERYAPYEKVLDFGCGAGRSSTRSTHDENLARIRVVAPAESHEIKSRRDRPARLGLPGGPSRRLGL